MNINLICAILYPWTEFHYRNHFNWIVKSFLHKWKWMKGNEFVQFAILRINLRTANSNIPILVFLLDTRGYDITDVQKWYSFSLLKTIPHNICISCSKNSAFMGIKRTICLHFTEISFWYSKRSQDKDIYLPILWKLMGKFRSHSVLFGLSSI